MINPVAAALALLEPLQGFRYMVIYKENLGWPMMLDLRFSKVSGLSQSARVHTIKSGGQNLYDHRFPDGIQHENLVLTRGMPIASPLRRKFIAALEDYKFKSATVFVMLMSESMIPSAVWRFENAWPVKWSFSDLDASSGAPMIETLELAYDRFVKML